MFKEFYISHKCQVISCLAFKNIIHGAHDSFLHISCASSQTTASTVKQADDLGVGYQSLADCNVQDTFSVCWCTSGVRRVPHLPHICKYAIHI